MKEDMPSPFCYNTYAGSCLIRNKRSNIRPMWPRIGIRRPRPSPSQLKPLSF